MRYKVLLLLLLSKLHVTQSCFYSNFCVLMLQVCVVRIRVCLGFVRTISAAGINAQSEQVNKHENRDKR